MRPSSLRSPSSPKNSGYTIQGESNSEVETPEKKILKRLKRNRSISHHFQDDDDLAALYVSRHPRLFARRLFASVGSTVCRYKEASSADALDHIHDGNLAEFEDEVTKKLRYLCFLEGVGHDV